MSSERKKGPAFNYEASSLGVWFTAPRKVEVIESQARTPGPGEVKVRALHSGISHGTEMLVYAGEVPPDLPLDYQIPTLAGSFAFPIKYGYANVGRVAEVGPEVEGLGKGDEVFAFNPHESLYTIPAQFIVKLPADINPRAAVFFANIETAINAMLDARLLIGERVVVLGQGVVGLLVTQLARRAGASLVVTVDLHACRRALSVALGADFSLDPAVEAVDARVRELTAGVGADVVIEASGQPAALDDAIQAAAFEGRVVVLSWYGTKRAPLRLGDAFHRNRITVRSSQVSNLDPRLGPRWCVGRRRELALSYLNQLRLEEMMTHTFPLRDAAEAYRLVDEHPDAALQVVLDYEEV